jgi:hypothetical protein
MAFLRCLAIISAALNKRRCASHGASGATSQVSGCAHDRHREEAKTPWHRRLQRRMSLPIYQQPGAISLRHALRYLRVEKTRFSYMIARSNDSPVVIGRVSSFD